jgi:hypothetical protein
MTLAEAVTNVLVSAGVVALVIFSAYRVVTWARRRAKRAYVVGALFSPFMVLGKVTDPDFRIVMEAQLHKKCEEAEPGDPPNPEDEAQVDAMAVEAVPRPTRTRRRAKWSTLLLTLAQKWGLKGQDKPA